MHHCLNPAGGKSHTVFDHDHVLRWLFADIDQKMSVEMIETCIE